MNVYLSKLRRLLLSIICIPIIVTASPLDSIHKQYQAGQFDLALTEINAVLSAEPNNVSALFIRAQIEAERQQTDAAIETYQKVILNKADHLEAYNNLAALYANQGKLMLARQTLEKAISTHPLFNTLHTNLRTIYMDLSKNHYQQALKQKSQSRSTQLAVYNINKMDDFTELDDESAAAKLEDAIRALIETKPETESDAAQQSADNPSQKAVKLALLNWAKAWSNQDIDRYLSAYRHNYAAGGRSNENWENSRRWNLKNKKYIKIALTDIEILEQGNRYRARFVQAYESDTVTEVTQKELIFVLQAGLWKIEKEQNG